MSIENQFSQIVNLILESRQRAFKAVNVELIELYWKVGKHLADRTAEGSWGKSVVKKLAEFISQTEPTLKGFSHQNLWRMKQFYEFYKGDEKISALTREISWTNNLIILSSAKSSAESIYYLQLSAKEKYSSRELERQISSGSFERNAIAATKLSAVLRETHPEANAHFKDQYILDFLGLHPAHSEVDLRKAIVADLKRFILEFGKDFSFIGEEYRVQVGKKDFYIDLLFYHRKLQCLVAFDLKITDFKPEYLGKMEFYLEALDRDVKHEHEKPSVGIILCKNKDAQIVEYALSRSMSPTLVSQYETQLIDKKLLELKLNEFYLLAENTI